MSTITQGIVEARTDALAELQALDRLHAPGSETPLWGPCRDELLACETVERMHEALDWWRLAYAALDEWDRPETYEDLLELGVDSDTALARAKGRKAADFLRRTREVLGLSLTAMGEHLDVDRSTVHRWETGALIPSSPRMLALAVLQLREQIEAAAPNPGRVSFHFMD